MIPLGYTCHRFCMVVLHMDVQQFHNERQIALRHTCNDIDQVLYFHKYRRACTAHGCHNNLNLKLNERN